MSDKLAEMGRYHIARKQIPSMHGPVAVSGGRSDRLHACLPACMAAAGNCRRCRPLLLLLLPFVPPNACRPIRCFAC